jgi:hypothetical protein
MHQADSADPLPLSNSLDETLLLKTLLLPTALEEALSVSRDGSLHEQHAVRALELGSKTGSGFLWTVCFK